MNLEYAIRNTVFSRNTTVKAIALDMGRSEQTVYGWADTDRESYPPLMDVPRLMRVTGNYAILQSLARAVGYVAIRLPRRVRRPSPRTVGELQRQMNECAQRLMDMDDGKATRQEATDEIYGLIENLCTLMRGIEQGDELPIEDAQGKLFT